MALQRVALIFDNVVRPDTTGGYCLRALSALLDVQHFLPSQLSDIPRQGFDLYLNIDDGLDYRLPRDLRPCAWWAIDTHLNFDWCLNKARDFDVVFAAQRDGAEGLRRQGITSATWLPLACDPDIHRKHDVAKTFDVAFVGHMFPGPRAELLESVRHRFPNSFIGQRYFEDMAKTYSASRIVFNRSIRNDINMRVFEAIACGSLLLTNDLRENGQGELFQDETHLATYRGAEELLDKVAFYLAHEQARERIAAAGREEALARHTYRHRMETLLAKVGQALSPAPPLSGPAHRGEASGTDPTDKGPAPASPPDDVAPTGGHDPLTPPRQTLAALVPHTARTVLDVGCGTGSLGQTLKARQQVEVIGIELLEERARAARTCLDHVFVGDVEQMELPLDAHRFDAVVCGVLERLRHPIQVLRQARTWLRPEGNLVASVANARYHPVVRSLLEGNWPHAPAGILSPPLHAFTRREVEKLFYRAGFRIEELRPAPGAGHADWQRRGRPGEVSVGRLHIGALAPSEAEEFYVCRYLVRAKSIAEPDHGLTSIVILTHNQLDYTRQCLASIRQYTDEPYELIVVDNGSTDGTPDYLRSLPGVRVILNAHNRGFPMAANQGIRAASGRQVLLLNNDTLATTGWLKRMLQALHLHPGIGLVGPCSNCVSGEQQVPVRYDDPAGLDGFAWDFGTANGGRCEDTDRLVGFCLLIRREVIERIGLLDERFGVGCFEDDDFCRRALKAGYRAVIARDAFVHHYGGRTFVGSGVDFAALMRQNEQLFSAKWAEIEQADGPPQAGQRQETVPSRGGYSVHDVSPMGGLLLGQKDLQLSLCMICRDNERTIGPALESIKPWVDELVVVDTGSTDRTPEIVRRHGARLFHFPWCDDFSTARNESVRHARGRWVFWMDSDDTIDPENGRKLRELAYREGDASVLGYVMQVHCPGVREDGEREVTVVDHVKLFRNLPQLRFDGMIHEQILPAIRQAGGSVAWTSLFVAHSGSDQSPESQQRKLERDLRILHKELKQRPEHPFTLFNLGMTYADAGEHAKAVDFLCRSIRRAGEGESHLRKAYALLVSSYVNMRNHRDAWEACQRGLSAFPSDLELQFRRATLLHERGTLAEAEQAYQALLRTRPERYFSSMVRGITGHLARHNLALVYEDMGEPRHAEEQWRLVTEAQPTYRAGWRGLGEVLLRQGKHQEALAVADLLLQDGGLRGEGRVLKGRTLESQGDTRAAQAEFERAVKECPNDLQPLRALCRFLFEHGEPAETERALAELARQSPQDPSTYHNLGSVRLRMGRYREAAEAYYQSLRLRPDSPTTHLHLGYAFQNCGHLEKAAQAFEQVLRLVPRDPAATEALRQVRQAAA